MRYTVCGFAVLSFVLRAEAENTVEFSVFIILVHKVKAVAEKAEREEAENAA